MKTKDLIILTFPTGSHEKDEVRISGLYLFTKHVRKHLLKKDLPNEEVLKASKTLEESSAERAWLIEIASSEEIETVDKLVEGKHYKILQQTHAFVPDKFSPDTGIYIVAHNEWNVTQVFGYFHLSLDKRIPEKVSLDEKYELASTRGATGVVRVIQGLGINAIRKLCMAACTMATPAYQKGFLISLVGQLAAVGLNPLVAGWDIPITVTETGSKEAVGAYKGPLKDHRKKHKFIYKFTSSGPISFSTQPKELDTKVKEHLHLFAKKNVEAKDEKHKTGFEKVALNKKITEAEGKKGKTDYTLSFDYVERIRYSAVGWSSSII